MKTKEQIASSVHRAVAGLPTIEPRVVDGAISLLHAHPDVLMEGGKAIIGRRHSIVIRLALLRAAHDLSVPLTTADMHVRMTDYALFCEQIDDPPRGVLGRNGDLAPAAHRVAFIIVKATASAPRLFPFPSTQALDATLASINRYQTSIEPRNAEILAAYVTMTCAGRENAMAVVARASGIRLATLSAMALGLLRARHITRDRTLSVDQQVRQSFQPAGLICEQIAMRRTGEKE
jgi:hypothetical protein